jgi:hypothetical protein
MTDKCLSGRVFQPSREGFQFWKQKEITWGKVWRIQGVRQNGYFIFFQKRRNYCGDMRGGHCNVADGYPVAGRRFLSNFFSFLSTTSLKYLIVILLPFFTGTFIATPSQEKTIAYKTLHSKIVWQSLLGVCCV